MDKFNPTIIIPGIGQSKVDMIDSKGNKIKSAWPFDIDMKSALDDLKGSIMKMMLFRKDAGFSDKVAKIVRSITFPLSCKSDGSSLNPLRTVTYEKSVKECTDDEKRFIYKMIPMEALGEKIGEENLFFFAYNPFGDVYPTAEKLNEFIEFVKEKTQSEKVDIIAVSLGGAVLKAYLDMYADKKNISSIVCVCSALDGTKCAGDIFTGNLDLDDPVKYLSYAGDKASQIAPMVNMIPKDVVDLTLTKSIDTAKNDLLYNCTMMWACVPVSDFAEASDKHLKNADPVLKEKVMRFYNYSLTFPGKIRELAKDGVRFCIVSGYGKQFLPIFESKNEDSDSVINVSSSSLGAQSSDGNIDVSTCVLPENTWFFKNQGHSAIAYNDVVLSLAEKFITGEIENVHSSESYPQFNTARNIKKLKYELVPKAEKTINDETVSPEIKDKLKELNEKYSVLLKTTVTENAQNVTELENEYKAVFDSIKNKG